MSLCEHAGMQKLRTDVRLYLKLDKGKRHRRQTVDHTVMCSPAAADVASPSVMDIAL